MSLIKKILRKPYRAARKLLYLHKTHRYNVTSVKSWCEQNQCRYDVIPTSRTVTVTPPEIICEGIAPKLSPVEAALPEVYLARLENVQVIECSDMVVVNKKTVVYDEMALDREGKYEERNNLSKLILSRKREPNRISLKYSRDKQHTLPNTAIHFCKDYSFNYFHWLIEALPRLSIIEKFKELDGLPLLIDSTLYPQQIEALEYLTQGKREIIKLKTNHTYQVKNLIYPSCLSHVHNNYYYPVDFSHDIVISPLALQYLREKFSPLMSQTNKGKHFYISRRNVGSTRRLLNDDTVEAFFKDNGYDIVYPEQMTFREQVTLFSEASVVIGASGSAFANMIFASPRTQFFILSANNKQVNFTLFSGLAEQSQSRLGYILGEDKIINNFAETHNAFEVSTKLLSKAIESINFHSSTNQAHVATTQ